MAQVIAEEEEVTLVADEHRFKCNKRKLIASSDYFRAMFTSNFTEKDKEVILLQDVDAECLGILLQYVHYGSLSINENNVLGLLQIASMLQFTEVQKVCEKEIYESLSCESCLDIYAVASSLDFFHIAAAARTIALWNFRKIAAMPQFIQLSQDAIVEYLTDPSLITGPGGEWAVWEAIASWIDENVIERGSHIMCLLKCLDLKKLTIDDISNMLFFSIVSENDEVVQLLECIKCYKRDCSLLHKKSVQEVQPQSRNADAQRTEYLNSEKHQHFYKNCLSRKPSLIPSVVGFKRLHSRRRNKAKNSDDEEDYRDDIPTSQSSELVPVLYTFNLSSGKISEEFSLTKLCHGPVLCSGFQVCSVGPSVYILGGEFLYGHGNWNDSLWRYSTATRKWIIENALPEPRRHHMICVADHIIFMLGGSGRHRIVLSSMKAYDTESGEWLSCPDMPHTVSTGAVCAFKSRLLVFTQDMQLLTYYPSMKKWSAIPIISPSKRGYRAALPWKDSIYLIDNCSNKVFKYSPEGQTVLEYGSFPSPPVNVCIVDEKIFSFSHDDMDNHVIEVLDIVDNNTKDIKGNLEDEQDASLSVCEKSEVMETHNVKKNNTDMEGIDKTIKALKDKDKNLLKVAKEVWRESDDGPYIFTTKYPADTTFSLGCFPLLKVI